MAGPVRSIAEDTLDLMDISQRDLLHAAPDPTLIVDADGHIVFASGRVRVVFGYDPEELIGQPIEVLVPERHRGNHQSHRAGYVESPRSRPMGSTLDLFARRKDGSEFPVEISLSPVETDRGVLVSSSVRDITDRRLTENLLVRERAFLDSMISTAPTIVLLLSPKGLIQQVNPYMEQVSGFRADDLTGKDWFDTCLPDVNREEARRLFGETMDRGFNSGNIYPLVTADGELRQIEWMARTLVNGADEVIGLLNIGRDVTNQVEHESDLRQARREAEQANASKSRFLAAASHDLRQPLQSLGLYLSVLARQLNEPKPLEICDKMRKSLDTMGELLDALLDISRLDSGSVVPEMEDVRIDTLLDRVVTDNVQQAEEKGLTLKCERTDWVVHTDPGLLERVIENLVTNAIRYTERGGVVISCESVGDRARISVADTGIGIPDDALDRVFDEYYQLDNSVRDRRKGLGLGLSIVRHIGRLLELDLHVTSRVGEGSTFSVDVRRGEDQPGESAPGPAAARPGARHPVVLFVEDDPAVIDATTMLFDASGVSVHTATDGRSAVEQVAAGLVPDLLVCDYRLPGITGVDVIRQTREIVGREVPAVVMTGDTSAREIEAAQLQNCTILHKPVDTDRLLQLVESARPD